MVSFICDNCQKAVKKPQLSTHYARCHASFSCVDCYQIFTGTSWESHNSCISEEEKTQGRLYKPKQTKQTKENQKKRQATPSEDIELSPPTKKIKKSESSEEQTHKLPDPPTEDKTSKSLDQYSHIKVKKIIKKLLKKSPTKSLTSDELLKEALKVIHEKMESDLKLLINQEASKFHIEGDVVYLKSSHVK